MNNQPLSYPYSYTQALAQVPTRAASTDPKLPDANDARLAATLQELKSARARLDSSVLEEVQAAERQIGLIAGYLASWCEASNIPIYSFGRSTAVPAITLFTQPANLGEAVDGVIRALEEQQPSTRMPLLVPFLVGVGLGYGVGKLIDYAFG